VQQKNKYFTMFLSNYEIQDQIQIILTVKSTQLKDKIKTSYCGHEIGCIKGTLLYSVLKLIGNIVK